MTDKGMTEHEGLLTWRALALQERERADETSVTVNRVIAMLEERIRELESSREAEIAQARYERAEAEAEDLRQTAAEQSALYHQALERVQGLEAEVARLLGELADCAKTCGGLEYRLHQAEAEVARLNRTLRMVGEAIVAQDNREYWQIWPQRTRDGMVDEWLAEITAGPQERAQRSSRETVP